MSWLNRWLKRKSRPGRKQFGPNRFVPGVEPLDERIALAVTASFLAQAGILSVFGDSLNNTITISRNAAGNILVNGGAVAIQGGTSTVANTALVQVFGQAGDDTDLNEGGAGSDTVEVNGGNGADVLLGGDGNDFIDGNQGNDLAFLGAGDDVFQWDPGDGNDTVEGQDGADTMLFNGSGLSEIFEASANGGRVRFTRDVGNIVMDLNDVEAIDLNALGGADTIVVNDLSGTDVVEINLNLAAAGGAGDAQPDTVIVSGTAGDDVILVVGDASGVAVLGLAARVNITGAEAANDRLVVNALAGDDVVEASGLSAGAIQRTADGTAGDDILIGSDGDDILLGAAGDDVLIGGPGDNIVIQ
jgi:Ca2+-binding RTX toxin-like protein